MGNVNNTAGVGTDNQVSTMNASTTVAANGVHSNNTTTTSAGVQITSSVPHVYPFPCNIPLMESMAVPPIGKFSGEHESEAGEHFADWIEQFELVASVYHWDDCTKLVNLTTRLRGQAFAFYWSCSTQQSNDYKTSVSELKKRFTPVCLQAVQSSLFHDRKQKGNESVDSYAQELRTLFYRDYPQAQQGTEETEQMACTMLANQFAVGLRQEIKIKVAGVEGTLSNYWLKPNLKKLSLGT